MTKKINSRRGIAMSTVLIFITFIVILGIAVLLIAQTNAQQSAAIKRLDDFYYAAESAAQIATKEFINY
ncbi:MAG: hypothetical protein FWE82_10065, partial [Defluviitaleaceae bacterium]|nr:hypothetical protein [Defluviitaleaceae bacterium]